MRVVVVDEPVRKATWVTSCAPVLSVTVRRSANSPLAGAGTEAFASPAPVMVGAAPLEKSVVHSKDAIVRPGEAMVAVASSATFCPGETLAGA